MRESRLQSEIITWLRDQGAYVVNIYGSGRTAKGAPDLLVCHKGRFIAVECKVGSGRLSPAQVIHRERILKAGGVHLTPYTLQQFIAEFGEVAKDG